jgi:multidrug efflux pump subunit AcrA (membrane-fusion protein)
LITSPVVIARRPNTGSRVSQGQVLAEIETPELDQQLRQARAELANATATLEMSKTTAERWQALLKREVVSNHTISLEENPGKSYPGTLARTSNALDPNARTMLSEVEMENPNGEVLPGAYVVVRLRVGLATRGMTIPANALLFRSEGLRVVVVRNGRAELVPVKLGRDYGRTVEVVDGLTPADAVILDPANSLVSGTTVRVRPSAPSKTGG